jgi:signal transduction histidine kinase
MVNHRSSNLVPFHPNTDKIGVFKSKYKFLIDKMLYMVVVATPVLKNNEAYDIRYEEVNKEWETNFGIPRNMCLGKTYGELFGRLDKIILSDIDKVLRGSQCENFDAFFPLHQKYFKGNLFKINNKIAFVFEDTHPSTFTKEKYLELVHEIEVQDRKQLAQDLHDGIGPIFPICICLFHC